MPYCHEGEVRAPIGHSCWLLQYAIRYGMYKMDNMYGMCSTVEHVQIARYVCMYVGMNVHRYLVPST